MAGAPSREPCRRFRAGLFFFETRSGPREWMAECAFFLFIFFLPTASTDISRVGHPFFPLLHEKKSAAPWYGIGARKGRTQTESRYKKARNLSAHIFQPPARTTATRTHKERTWVGKGRKTMTTTAAESAAAARPSQAGIHATAAAWVGAEALGPATCARAASEGRNDVILWLRLAGCPWDATACTAAAAAGHLATLKFLRSGDEALGGEACPWDETTCAAAAAAGRIKVIEWLRAGADPCPWDARAMAAAAAAGHFAMIYWLRGMRRGAARIRAPLTFDAASWDEWRARRPVRCPCDATVFAAAAATGRIDVMASLYARGVPWDATACAAAARNGHVDALAWLRNRQPPCPWDERTPECAAAGGHLGCLASAAAGGWPQATLTTPSAAVAAHDAPVHIVLDEPALQSQTVGADVLPKADDAIRSVDVESPPTDAPGIPCLAPPATTRPAAAFTRAAHTASTPLRASRDAPAVAGAAARPIDSSRRDWADQDDDLDNREADHMSAPPSRKRDQPALEPSGHRRAREDVARPPRRRSGAKERAKRERRAQAASATTTATVPPLSPVVSVVVVERRSPPAIVRPEFSFAAAAAAAAPTPQPIAPTVPSAASKPPDAESPKARRRKRGGKGRH